MGKITTRKDQVKVKGTAGSKTKMQTTRSENYKGGQIKQTTGANGKKGNIRVYKDGAYKGDAPSWAAGKRMINPKLKK